jgi:hypothetical protein
MALADPPAGSSPALTGYAPVNGLSMYYEIHGEGRPLVLLDLIPPFLDEEMPESG